MTAEQRPSSLRLDTVTDAESAVVIVRGDVDAATAPQLRAVLDGVVAEAVTLIELDLGEVGFFDSTGLGVLASTIVSLERVRGTLRVRHASPMILRLLSISDLLRHIDIVEG